MKYNFELNLETDNSLSLIVRQLKPGTTILEFGPAYGRLTKYMKEQMACSVYLVEIDGQAGAEASKYGSDIVIDDIESYSWYDRYKDISFDFVIFADVLEHLRNPGEVLKKAARLLADDGRMLLSVPNLAHNSVIIDLMNDRFTYNPTGLLDDTHIRFFTRTSLEAMISECDLYITKKMATYAPVGTIEIQNSVHDVKGIEAGFWNTRKHGEVYQYVYELSNEQPCEVSNPGNTSDTIDDIVPHYIFQYYYSKSKEFNEADSKIQFVDIRRGGIDMVIRTEPEWKYMRIDPLDTNCILHIDDVHAVCDDGNIPLVPYWSNAPGSYENYWWFACNDPGIAYEIPENTREIIFSCSIKAADFDDDGSIACLRELLTSLNDKNRTIENRLTGLTQEMLKTTELLNMERQRADALQEWADGLRSKKLYRLYNFFRKIFFKAKQV